MKVFASSVKLLDHLIGLFAILGLSEARIDIGGVRLHAGSLLFDVLLVHSV